MADDEHKLLRDAERASQAQALLDNDLIREAFDNLEQEYTEALFVTRPDQVQGRESLYLAVNVVRKVRAHLSNIIGNGKLASSVLRELTETAERKKTWPEVRH
jgi:hypothetical protein